jgi:hypothetical protein
MDFYRARKSNLKYIKYDKSFIHNTALIASEDINMMDYLVKVKNNHLI